MRGFSIILCLRWRCVVWSWIGPWRPRPPMPFWTLSRGAPPSISPLVAIVTLFSRLTILMLLSVRLSSILPMLCSASLPVCCYPVHGEQIIQCLQMRRNARDVAYDILKAIDCGRKLTHPPIDMIGSLINTGSIPHVPATHARDPKSAIASILHFDGRRPLFYSVCVNHRW